MTTTINNAVNGRARKLGPTPNPNPTPNPTPTPPGPSMPPDAAKRIMMAAARAAADRDTSADALRTIAQAIMLGAEQRAGRGSDWREYSVKYRGGEVDRSGRQSVAESIHPYALACLIATGAVKRDTRFGTKKEILRAIADGQ